MTLTYLKVKIKSLAAEARIIRHEETRFPRGFRDHPTFQGLHSHRTWDVRREARSALLAYAYLRGRLYSTIEGGSNEKRSSQPDIVRIMQLIYKYGSDKGMAPWLSKERRYELHQHVRFGWIDKGATPVDLREVIDNV